MHYLKPKLKTSAPVYGVWCSMASSISCEIIACSGYDWALIDMEHAPGSNMTLLHQLQAMAAYPISPIVRIPALGSHWCKWALDLGAAGIMFPNIEDAAEAAHAVKCMRYPPAGTRGVGANARMGVYGRNFKNYKRACEHELLAIVQVESRHAVDNCQAIAAVDGVDIIFVGPADLGASLGIPEGFSSQEFVSIVRGICAVAKACGKMAGILVPTPDMARIYAEFGFDFIGIGSDSGILANALLRNLRQIRPDAIMP